MGTMLLINGAGEKVRQALKITLIVAVALLQLHMLPHQTSIALRVLQILIMSSLTVLGFVFCATGRKQK